MGGLRRRLGAHKGLSEKHLFDKAAESLDKCLYDMFHGDHLDM